MERSGRSKSDAPPAAARRTPASMRRKGEAHGVGQPLGQKLDRTVGPPPPSIAARRAVQSREQESQVHTTLRFRRTHQDLGTALLDLSARAAGAWSVVAIHAGSGCSQSRAEAGSAIGCRGRSGAGWDRRPSAVRRGGRRPELSRSRPSRPSCRDRRRWVSAWLQAPAQRQASGGRCGQASVQ
jgi:hypothetical protein